MEQTALVYGFDVGSETKKGNQRPKFQALATLFSLVHCHSFFFFFSFLLPSSFPLPCSHCNRMWHIPYQPQVHSSSSVNLEVTNSRNRSWSSHTGAKPHTSCCLPPGISVHIITLFTGVPRRSFYSPNAASLCLSSVS